jgi:Ca-activated chloride channel family protein
VTTDFLDPERLWLLLVVAALAVAYLVAQRWRRRAALRFTRADLLAQVAPSRPGWRRHVVAAVQLAALALAVVAIARPVERTTQRTRAEGRIVLLFDVSLSMMATDVGPDRFTAAQDAAQAFVDEVDDGVEVGLISFSGTVAVEVPPTLDRTAVERGIDVLELAESTAIGDALFAGTRLLTSLTDDNGDGGSDDSGERPPGVLVLLTDGETTVGRFTEEGAQIAADAGIPVYAIAFGTEGGTIADPDTGEIVPVPVRTSELANVADITGGESFAAESGQELADAYDEISELLGETLGDAVEVVTELTWRWAAAAFALLTIGWLLGLWLLRGPL